MEKKKEINVNTYNNPKVSFTTIEKRYLGLVANLDAGVIVHAPDTSIIYSNPRAAELLGLTEEQLTGKFASDPEWMLFKEDNSILPFDEFPVNEIRIKNLPIKNRVYGVKRQSSELIWLSFTGFPVYDMNGNILEIVISFIDITALKKAEKNAKENEKRLLDVYKLSHIGVWKWVAATDSVTWNDELFLIAGLDPNGPAPTYAEHPNIYTPESWEYLNATVEKSMATGNPYEIELELVRPDGSIRNVIIFGGAEYDSNGNVSGLFGTVQDISERKLSERILIESEKKFRSYVENATDGVFVINRAGYYLEVNLAATSMLGYTREEILSMHFSQVVVPESIDSANIAYTTLLEKGRFSTEITFLRKDGSNFTGILSAIKLSEAQFLGLVKDITERKENEERVKSLLAEKEMILKEVHHRIKNNMSAIQGLFVLQADSLHENEEAVLALQDAANRVQSMMMLYDKLYQSNHFSRISIQYYLSPLINEIILNFPIAIPIEIIKQIDDFILDAKTLSSIGIIINELLTNIMKYAFHGKTEGQIAITIRLEGNQISIRVQDNGVGLSNDINLEKSSGFGLMLVQFLVKQLQANLKIEAHNGTTVLIEFEI
ncbi:MAG: PAS domain S-box protein [Leptospiraceae bacterium]|nr:PAS domain S-box protein [Leptospiraceae bacterium]